MNQTNGDTSRLQFENHRFFHDLLGHQDEHLRGIEKALGVKIAASGTSLLITGDEEQRLLAVEEQLQPREESSPVMVEAFFTGLFRHDVTARVEHGERVAVLEHA